MTAHRPARWPDLTFFPTAVASVLGVPSMGEGVSQTGKSAMSRPTSRSIRSRRGTVGGFRAWARLLTAVLAVISVAVSVSAAAAGAGGADSPAAVDLGTVGGTTR